MKINHSHSLLIVILLLVISCSQQPEQKQFVKREITPAVMEEIYQEIRTPYKYGLVMVPENNSYKLDCPSVFRHQDNWYMTYLIFDGRGYETWLAKSSNLL